MPRLVDGPIDVTRMLAAVADSANGATVLFLGTVRDVNDGRRVSGIEYSAYRSMAERELDAILEEARSTFGTEHIEAEHRLGELSLGEISVAVVAAHPRRAQGFDAARYVVEELKQRLPIWKLEQYVDGSREWVNAGAPQRVASAAPAGTAGTAGTAAADAGGPRAAGASA